MNRWMWRTAAVVVLCCVLPGVSSARTRGSRFSQPRTWQGNVQRFRTHPACVWSEVADAFHEARDALPDGVVDIESEEEAHRTLLAFGFWLLA